MMTHITHTVGGDDMNLRFSTNIICIFEGLQLRGSLRLSYYFSMLFMTFSSVLIKFPRATINKHIHTTNQYTYMSRGC